MDSFRYFIVNSILLLLLAFNLNAQDSLKVNISPITFNVSDEKITLIYHSRELTRKDTFDIDPNKTIQYLKDALKKYYKINVPNQWAQRINEGGYYISSKIIADHQALRNESLSLKEVGLKALDVIEIDYYLSQRATMGCYLRDTVVKINGIDIEEDANPILIIGGEYTSTETIVYDGSYQFYFEVLGLCNPDSWVAKLEIGDKWYYLANPTQDGFDTSFPSDLKLQFDIPKEED